MTGKVSKGSAVVYTLTIPTRVVKMDNALALSTLLLNIGACELLKAQGLLKYNNMAFAGNLSNVPLRLQSVLTSIQSAPNFCQSVSL